MIFFFLIYTFSGQLDLNMLWILNAGTSILHECLQTEPQILIDFFFHISSVVVIMVSIANHHYVKCCFCKPFVFA